MICNFFLMNQPIHAIFLVYQTLQSYVNERPFGIEIVSVQCTLYIIQCPVFSTFDQIEYSMKLDLIEFICSQFPVCLVWTVIHFVE